MRVIRPAPKPPPRSLTRKLSESPTPCRYFAICSTVLSALGSVFSCSFSNSVLPGLSFPDKFRKSLKTLVNSAFFESISASPGPFHVPSAQKTMFLLTTSPGSINAGGKAAQVAIRNERLKWYPDRDSRRYCPLYSGELTEPASDRQ